MDKVVIALSGGLDSSTLLGVLLHSGKEVHCCLFRYPSKHNPYEMLSALEVIKHYKDLGFPVHEHVFDLTNIFVHFNSNLLLQGGEIPEGHYEQENMKLTVVPGRNSIFTTILGGFAESIGASTVYLGVHAGDHAIYPDCRPDFIGSINHTIELSSGGAVSVEAPFIHLSKSEIVTIGVEEMVPFHLTRNCYKNQSAACGKCGSCNERLEAFELAGIKDPIKYE